MSDGGADEKPQNKAFVRRAVFYFSPLPQARTK